MKCCQLITLFVFLAIPKLLKCSLCPKEFKARRFLLQHQITHSDIKRFVCSICGKAWKKKYHMEVHYLSHLSEKDRPVQCEQCPKRFINKTVLKQHMACHSDVKAFACEFCGNKYKAKHHLSIHAKKNHPEMFSQPENS